MKAMYTLLAVAVALVSCKDDNKGLLDPNAKVYISPAAGVAMQSASKAQGHLTAHEIVQKAEALFSTFGVLGIDDWNRDLVNNRFRMASTAVISQRGELSPDFIESRDIILTIQDDNNRPADTIAYLPNAVMAEAEKSMRTAYSAKDYALCYKLFEEAFVFKPITGNEWRALKAKNEN